MRIYLDQIGCRLNYSEIESLAGRLQAVGHQTVAAPEHAQVIVFNSCAVTADAGRSSRQRVRQLHRRNPLARIAVTGCWATLRPRQAAALPGVALVVDNGDKELLSTLLEPWSADFDDPSDLMRLQPDGNPFPAATLGAEPAARAARTRAFVKVQDGCDNHCTFCVVTIARGRSRSRLAADVVAEIQASVEEGVQEAVLTGVHLGAYGRDLDGSRPAGLRDLVTTILAETGLRRLRLSSLEPWDVADGFFDLWQRWPQRLCPHLHLPLQAGTDKQLRRMARRGTVQSFRQLVGQARAAIPDLIVTTDLIVGFPGETEDDFAAGMAFVEEMRFAHAHIFPFSARSGTTAAAYGDQVAAPVKKERARRLHALVAQTGLAARLRFVGTQRPVLWEGQGQPVRDGPGRLWSGLTDNHLRVMAVAPASADLHNQVILTRLEELHGDTLFGTLAGTLAAAASSSGT